MVHINVTVMDLDNEHREWGKSYAERGKMEKKTVPQSLEMLHDVPGFCVCVWQYLTRNVFHVSTGVG